MEEEHKHFEGLEIECEKCGGVVKVVNMTYPNAYECICEKCKHKFTWVSPEEKW